MPHAIKFSQTSLTFLDRLQKDHCRTIIKRSKELANDPEKQGKPLPHIHPALRRIRVMNYRVLYMVKREENTVFIVAIGIRKEGDKEDIYQQIQRVLKTIEAEWATIRKRSHGL